MTETRFTEKEAGVLDLLQRNAGRIVTRAVFLENVWGYKSGVKSRTLDMHISKLRAKLGSRSPFGGKNSLNFYAPCLIYVDAHRNQRRQASELVCVRGFWRKFKVKDHW